MSEIVARPDLARPVEGTRDANAWIEDMGSSIAVHYRQAPDPDAARAALMVALQPVATESGLEVVEGEMVIELLPRDRPMKWAALERIAGEHELLRTL